MLLKDARKEHKGRRHGKPCWTWKSTSVECGRDGWTTGSVILVMDLAEACEKVQLKVVCPGASLGKRRS